MLQYALTMKETVNEWGICSGGYEKCSFSPCVKSVLRMNRMGVRDGGEHLAQIISESDDFVWAQGVEDMRSSGILSENKIISVE